VQNALQVPVNFLTMTKIGLKCHTSHFESHCSDNEFNGDFILYQMKIEFIRIVFGTYILDFLYLT